MSPILFTVYLFCLLGATCTAAEVDTEADLLFESPLTRECNSECGPQAYFEEYCRSIEGQWYFRTRLTAGTDNVTETGDEYGAAVGAACINNCSMTIEALSIPLSGRNPIDVDYELNVTKFQNSGRLFRLMDDEGNEVACQAYSHVQLGCVSGGLFGNDLGTAETNIASYKWEFERGFPTSQCGFPPDVCTPRPVIPSPSPSPSPTPTFFFPTPTPTPTHVPTPSPSPSPSPTPSPLTNPLPVVGPTSMGLTDGEVAVIVLGSTLVVVAIAAVVLWAIFAAASGPMVFQGAGPSMLRENFEG